MKFQEIEGKDLKELQEMLKQSRIKLGKLRFELANKSLKDFSQIAKTKKDAARIATAINRIAKSEVGNMKQEAGIRN